MSHKPHPSNKGLQTAWPEQCGNFRELPPALKDGPACGPSTVFFLFKNVSHIFRGVARGSLFALFCAFFLQIFSNVPFTHVSNTFV